MGGICAQPGRVAWIIAVLFFGIQQYTAYPGLGSFTAPNLSNPRTISTCYGSGGTVNGYACTDDGYHTYPAWQRDALGNPTTFVYDKTLGVLTSETDPNNVTTTATYDTFGRLVSILRPPDSGYTFQVAYHDTTPSWTETTQKIDAAHSQVQRRFYDGLGRLIQSQEANVEVNGVLQDVLVDTTYDAAGRQSTQSVPYAVSPGSGYRNPSAQPNTVWLYDALGRPTQVTAPDGSYQQSAYQVPGGSNILRTLVTNARGYTTTTDSDSWGRAVQVTPPTGPGVSYSYDPLDRLVGVTRGGQGTTLGYDYTGRKTSMTDPDMGTWSYAYDAIGNLLAQDDAKNQRTCLYYDGLNRLTGKYYTTTPTACPTSPTLAVSYGYDSTAGGNKGIGRRTSLSDPAGTTAWVYDERGRVTGETRTVSGISGSFKTEWHYNSADLIDWMKYPEGNTGNTGEQVNYNYLNGGRLESVSGTDSYAQGLRYDPAGRLTLLKRGAGNGIAATTYTYFAWTQQGGRLQRIYTDRVIANPDYYPDYQDLNYTYDAGGNVLTIQDAIIGQTQSFTYDGLERLSSAQAAGGTGGTYGPESYAYNASTGNLDSKAGVSYTYGSQSAACSDGALSKPHAVVTAGSNTYCYDRNGNQVKRTLGGSAYTLSYDAENRLTGVSGAATASFVYDGDGRQVKATVGGVTTVYIGGYYEWTSAGNTRYYTAAGQRLAMRRAGYATDNGLFWLFSDHLGSTSLRVAGNGGSPSSELRFKAWGETRYTSGTQLTKYQFTGQRNETASFGLYFYQARWYDPYLNRWIQPDSIIPDQNDSQSLDRYAFVRNNPVNRIDPTGYMDICPDCGDGGDLTDEERLERIRAIQASREKNDSTIVLPTIEDMVDLFVPDAGCIGVGFSSTVGGFIYVTVSVGFFVDSHGNFAAISPSIGGGALLPLAVEGALYVSGTNANYVDQLEGWNMVIGGSIEAEGSVGGEAVFFKDSSTGQKFSGGTLTLGLGAAGPVPAEGHIGVNYTWVPVKFNLFDIFGLPRHK